jgi:hypothetical protein
VKKPTRKLPPVIPAPPELLAKMQRLFAQPPVSFEEMKAQTDMVLKGRTDASESKPESPSGRLRKAG